MKADAIKRRIDRFLDLYGEDFLVNTTETDRGAFLLMSSGEIHSLYIDAEASSITRPANKLILKADSPLEANSLVTRDVRTMVVRRIFTYKVNNTPVFRIAALD